MLKVDAELVILLPLSFSNCVIGTAVGTLITFSIFFKSLSASSLSATYGGSPKLNWSLSQFDSRRLINCRVYAESFSLSSVSPLTSFFSIKWSSNLLVTFFCKFSCSSFMFSSPDLPLFESFCVVGGALYSYSCCSLVCGSQSNVLLVWGVYYYTLSFDIMWRYSLLSF